MRSCMAYALSENPEKTMAATRDFNSAIARFPPLQRCVVAFQIGKNEGFDFEGLETRCKGWKRELDMFRNAVSSQVEAEAPFKEEELEGRYFRKSIWLAGEILKMSGWATNEDG